MIYISKVLIIFSPFLHLFGFPWHLIKETALYWIFHFHILCVETSNIISEVLCNFYLICLCCSGKMFISFNSYCFNLSRASLSQKYGLYEVLNYFGCFKNWNRTIISNYVSKRHYLSFSSIKITIIKNQTEIFPWLITLILNCNL